MALSGTLTPIKNFWDNTHSHRITWTATQDILNNKSTVTANFESKFLSSFGNYEEQAGANKIRLAGTTFTRSTYFKGTGNNTWITQFSAVKTIIHNADGTAKFKLGAQHRANNAPGDYYYWADEEFNLDTIPRNSTIGTISGNTLGSNVTVNITRASTSYRHEYAVYFPNTSTQKTPYTNVPSGSGGGSFTFSAPTSWGSSIPGASSGTAYVYLKTFSGNTQIGSTVSKSFTLNVPGTGPIISNVSVTEANPSVSSVTSSFVQSKSRLNISFTATGQNGATVTSRKIVTNGQTFSGSSATTSTLNSAGSGKPIQITATDSRGNTTTYNTTYNVISYSAPYVASFSATRRSSPNTTIDISYTANWGKIGTSTFRVTENGTLFSTKTSSSSTGTYSNTVTRTGKSDTSSFTYIVTITDAFGAVASRSYTVGMGFQELTIRPGQGVGIGKIHETGQVLDVGGKARFRGDIELNGVFRSDGRVECHSVDSSRSGEFTLHESDKSYLFSFGRNPGQTFINMRDFKGRGINIQTDGNFTHNLNKVLTLNNYPYLSGVSVDHCGSANFHGGFNVFWASSSTGGKPTGVLDGSLLSLNYSSIWTSQMFGDWNTNRWWLRSQKNGTWSKWKSMGYDFEIHEVTVPAATYQSSTQRYNGVVSVTNRRGVVPTGMLALKLTSSGNGILVDVNTITTSTITMNFSRNTTFSSHSQTVGLLYFWD